MLMRWIEEAEGEDKDSGRIKCEFIYSKRNEFAVTSIDEDTNPYSKTFRDTCSRLGVKFSTEVFPAATDSRYLRERGIPAFGFSPINNTPILLHDHNEFLSERVFLRGIEILYNIVLDLANTKL
jgi:aminoacylase